MAGPSLKLPRAPSKCKQTTLKMGLHSPLCPMVSLFMASQCCCACKILSFDAIAFRFSAGPFEFRIRRGGGSGIGTGVSTYGLELPAADGGTISLTTRGGGASVGSSR
jgi:hypothetical protein